jgi:putative sterol carrier protein
MNTETMTEILRNKVGEDSGLNATVKFDCGDDGIFFVDAKSKPNVVSNSDGEADCTVTLELDLLNDLTEGSIEPSVAFMTGRLSVEGDMDVAMRLKTIL